jgi:hypothetical protein
MVAATAALNASISALSFTASTSTGAACAGVGTT